MFDKLGIECALQGCLIKNKFNKVINHTNNLVHLKDEKYGIDGIYYCDSRMDCKEFVNNSINSWMLNFISMPITDIGKINIKVWQDDTIIEMNDFQSLYYTKQLSTSDRDYLLKFFSQSTLDNIMVYKYCKPIEEKVLFRALYGIGLDNKMINEIQKNYFARKPMFFKDTKI